MSKRPASQELEHDPILAKRVSHFKVDQLVDMASVQDLALAILEDRSLVQYVRKVTLTYQYGPARLDQALPYTANTPEEKEKEEMFKAAIAEQKWEEPDATELLKRLMTIEYQGMGSLDLFPDAVVALLLPILPNVEQWTVGEIDWPYFVGRAIQRAKDGIFGSISVTRLKIKPNCPFSDAAWDEISWDAFAIYANLPLLRVITSKGVGGLGIEDGGRYEVIPRKVSAVREIHLKKCEISGTCVSNIINFSTGLEAFSYQFGGRAGDGGIVGWDSPRVAQALTSHRLTMRRMDIDVENQSHGSLQDEMGYWLQELKEHEQDKDSDNDQEDEESDTETLNSEDSKKEVDKWEKLTKSEPYFPNLTHLRIGIKLAGKFAELCGKTLAEWFPATLEELEIVGYRHSETGEMAEVVRRQEELLPKLQLLRGIEDYIECGDQLRSEDDYVTSVASDDELIEDGPDSE